MINRIYISIVLICLYSCTPDGFDPSLVFDEPGGGGNDIDSNCYIPIDNEIGFQKKIKDDQYFDSIYHNNPYNTLSASDLLIDINSLSSFVILGKRHTQGDDDPLLFKMDSSGAIIDLKEYDNGEPTSFIKTADGGYIIIGDIVTINNEDGEFYDIMLLKVDSDGNEQWIKTFGEYNYQEKSYSIQQSSDGGYIILGTNNNSDWIIKTDANGNIIWSKINEGRVIQTIDEGFLWIFDSSLISTSADGDTSWSKYFEDIHWVQQTNDEGYIIRTNSGNLIKTNKNGNIEWENNITRIRDIIQTHEGGYMIIRTWPDNSHLIKLDNQGNMEWEKVYCDEFGDKSTFKKVIQINENEYFIVATNKKDILLIKTDSEGNTSRLN
tara:strand:- start:82 stop:1221 length:1140 start_codon:yes stop_codon:yes gene_type:complete